MEPNPTSKSSYDMENKQLDAALYYLNKCGFSVIPAKADKRPFIQWQQFQKEKPPESVVRKWWGEQYKFANIAIITGKVSGLTVLDVDTQKGKDLLEENLPDSFLTPIVNTPGGGEHLYCQYEDGVTNAVRFMDGCDIRSEGGYVIAPPSSDARGGWKWRTGCKITDIPISTVPAKILSLIKSFSLSSPYSNKINTIYGDSNLGNNESQIVTNSNISFSEGSRDETLFHLANYLVKGGMPQANILQYLQFFASRCEPPYPERDLQAKIKSALSRSQVMEKTVSQEVREFIAVTNSNFRVTEVEQWVTKSNKISNKAILMALKREVVAGTIEKLTQPGLYRVIDEKFESTNIRDVKAGEWLDVALPFGLDRYAHIASGNLICIAGVSNAGKSAIIFNMIKENMKKHKCWYFSAEMNKETAKLRIEKYQGEVDWDFDVVDNWNQGVDVLQPDDFNFLDWLDIPDDGQAYDIGKKLSKIQSKMKKGIAVVAMQKNPFNKNAIGGPQTMNRSSLYLIVDKDHPGARMEVTKAKAFDEINPNGFAIKFKIYNGINLYPEGTWEPEMEEKYKDFKGGRK